MSGAWASWADSTPGEDGVPGDPGAPRVIVRGLALMGGVGIERKARKAEARRLADERGQRKELG